MREAGVAARMRVVSDRLVDGAANELYEDIQDIRFVDTYLETKGLATENFVSGEDLLD